MAIVIGQRSISSTAATSGVIPIPPGACSTTLISSAAMYVTSGTVSSASSANGFLLPTNVPVTFRGFSGSAGVQLSVSPGTAVVYWLISTES